MLKMIPCQMPHAIVVNREAAPALCPCLCCGLIPSLVLGTCWYFNIIIHEIFLLAQNGATCITWLKYTPVKTAEHQTACISQFWGGGGHKGGSKTTKPHRNIPKNCKPHRIFPWIPKPHENMNQSNENTRLYSCTSWHPAWNRPKQLSTLTITWKRP